MPHVRAIPRGNIEVAFRVTFKSTLVPIAPSAEGLVVLLRELLEGFRPAPRHVVDLFDGVGELHGLQRHHKPQIPVGARAFC